MCWGTERKGSYCHSLRKRYHVFGLIWWQWNQKGGNSSQRNAWKVAEEIEFRDWIWGWDKSRISRFLCVIQGSVWEPRKIFNASPFQPGLDVSPVGSGKVLTNPLWKNSLPYIRITSDLFPSGTWNCLVPSKVPGSEKAINKLLTEWQMMGLQ